MKRTKAQNIEEIKAGLKGIGMMLSPRGWRAMGRLSAKEIQMIADTVRYQKRYVYSTLAALNLTRFSFML